ncbi:hypothetical protein DL95DRAFT_319922, partial [Leptodontidium sp. 2 PMI_412]
VVLVIRTGSSKTIVVIISTVIVDARTTILVLLIITLRGNILRRFHKVNIRPLV